MKQILTLSFGILLTGVLFAQKISTDNLPAPVTAAFKNKFSIAEKIQWEMDYDHYKAGFKVGNADFTATFDKDGKWLETETFLKPSELPRVVKTLLIKEFGELSGYKIETAEKIETFGKDLVYDVEVLKAEKTYDVIASDKGELIKKTEEKDDKKE